ncbi:CDP-alcohol phosphatidyltransferase family protein [Haematomicrobium sanguinis]|uniref:CDP-alcohol phosphatidyltransferase family protein n=1 Tax=Haematomicrobium sanguinis TaxID=479106 RepID=UPI0009498DBA|nr:CDP-alcohol phosphatidyltransferase family protein [Haematomicrobium sanguinis]
MSETANLDKRKTISELTQVLKGKQKTNKGASAYARFVNRPWGRYLAACAFKLGLTPNQVTAASALCSLVAIVLIAVFPASWLLGILIAVLLAGGYALDSADGQLARLRGGGSLAGEWFDHVVDIAKVAALHLAVLINWLQYRTEAPWVFAIPLTYQFVSVVGFFAIVLTDQMRRFQRGSSQMRLAGEGSSSVLYSVLVLPLEFGVLSWVFLLWGWPAAFTIVYALLALCYVLYLAAALIKWYREVRTFT